MRIFFSTLLLCCLFPACREKTIPEGVLPPREMEKVMWDLMVADEMVGVYSDKGARFSDSLKNTDLYQQVLSLHRLNRKSFRHSLDFYESHPDLFKEVIDSLKVRSDSASVRIAVPVRQKPLLRDSVQ